nr:CCA tRNA nucleotidyltransferase [Candidatus Brocadiales bacterium]
MTKKQIVQLLKLFPFEVHAVGGAVRDIILGREPNDIDLATPLTPTQIGVVLKNHKTIKVVNVEERYGLSRIRIDHVDYELMTYRSDYNTDGRHAEVEYVSSIQEDLKRRDITINAVALSSMGKFIDPQGGIADIKDKIIMAVGDRLERLREDLLRVLRVFRFAARYDFKIEAGLAQAILEVRDEFMEQLSTPTEGMSWERVLVEFDKAFQDEKPSRFLSLLKQYGYLDLLIPEFKNAENFNQPPKWHPEGHVWTHTLHVVDAADPDVRWEAFLHDIGKVHTAVPKEEYFTFHGHEKASASLALTIGKRFKMSNERVKALSNIAGLHMRPHQVTSDKAVRRFQFDAGEDLDKIHRLHQADVVDKPSGYYPDAFRELPTPVKRIVEGRDFIAKGFEPGPKIGKLVKLAHYLQLEHGLSDKFEIVELTIKTG